MLRRCPRARRSRTRFSRSASWPARPRRRPRRSTGGCRLARACGRASGCGAEPARRRPHACKNSAPWPHTRLRGCPRLSTIALICPSSAGDSCKRWSWCASRRQPCKRSAFSSYVVKLTWRGKRLPSSLMLQRVPPGLHGRRPKPRCCACASASPLSWSLARCGAQLCCASQCLLHASLGRGSLQNDEQHPRIMCVCASTCLLVVKKSEGVQRHAECPDGGRLRRRSRCSCGTQSPSRPRAACTCAWCREGWSLRRDQAPSRHAQRMRVDISVQ